MPEPEDTVVIPVSLEKVMLSSNIGPGFVKVCTPVCICRGLEVFLPAERKRCQTKCLRGASKWERPTWGQHRAASLPRFVWKKMNADGRSGKLMLRRLPLLNLAVDPTTRSVFLHHDLRVCNPSGQGRATLSDLHFS